MEVISLEEKAFHELFYRLVEEIKKQIAPVPDLWIDGTEAMRMMRITSTTTLQKLRDEGKIRYSQPMHKVILYDRESILQFIEKHSYNTF